ncbi:MAG: SIS domain-containing protein [Deltaproteobacteria bacterium]|jgi:D-sedoheptulose 7-phosphate isomerase|nr:SIS domain-containing protein [Deltaproteobacteria bacterium]
MTSYYSLYKEALQKSLGDTQVTDDSGNFLEQQQAIEHLCAFSLHISRNSKKQYLIGNGASMAFSDHMAVDWSKNGKVPTHAFSSPSLLTALGNDIGIDQLFASAINTYANHDDMLVAISSSGNSKNIIEAIGSAREKKMRVVTFSGLKPDNQLRKMGDLNFYVPAKTYGIVECAHQLLLHMWLDHYMGITEWDREHFQNMSNDNFSF